MARDLLTDTKIRQAKPGPKPYKLSDGSGLFLLVNPNGSRYWRMKYRISGREKMFAIGVYPEIGRTSVRDQILRVFEARRHRGEPYVSKASEAREIQNEWQSFYPDENPIGHSTARCHFPDLKVSIFNN